MAVKKKLTYQEKRAKEAAWLRRADEVLAEYGEPEGEANGTVPIAQPEPPDAA